MIFALFIATVAAAQNTPLPAPPAPAPGSPATYKSAEALAAVLKAATPNATGMTTSAIAINDQYRVNIVRRDKAAGAIAHPGNTELHYIVEGTGTIVTGGKIVRGAGGETATIEGGVTQAVKPGDVIIVPAGSPHWYSQADGAFTYLEVRWLAPK
jgi:mannose-6-phosphate isomerase-like protein (cupin superfamily)